MLIFYYSLVSCNNKISDTGYDGPKFGHSWKIDRSKTENQNNQYYLKSNDIINLIMSKIDDDGRNRHDVILRSHDAQFTIENNTFQEVVCHDQRLGGNDDVSKLTVYYLKFSQIFKLFSF